MAQQQKGSNSVSIVSLVWFKIFPPVFGGQKGIALYNEYLGRLVFLLCLCSKNNEKINSSFTINNSLPVSKWQFIDPRCWRKIYQTCKEQKATHIFLEFPYHAIAALLCRRFGRQKIILHQHNIESLRFKERKKWWWFLLYQYEKWICSKAAVVFFKTEKDRQTAIRQFDIKPAITYLIPFGITPPKIKDKESIKRMIYARHNIPPEKHLLLFAGTLDYGPNADAVSAIEKNIIPLLKQTDVNFTIVYCGRILYEEFNYLKELQNEHLIYAGNVPDMGEYFTAADVFINPVVQGGGVQTKNIDAISYHLNVVCFDTMIEGIMGADNKLFTAPHNDWESFTQAIERALGTKASAPPSFFEHHDWQKIAENSYQFILDTTCQ